MSLPKVTINYLNGMLGTVPESEDGLLVLACPVEGGNEMTDKVCTLQRVASLKNEKITAVNSPIAYKAVEEFYAEAGEGTPVILMGYSGTMQNLCNPDSPLRKLLTSEKGKIRGVLILSKDATNKADKATIEAAQNLAVWSCESRHAPIFVILDGRYSNTLPDLTSRGATEDLSKECNRVGVFVGNSEIKNDDKTQISSAIGLLAGRIAASPVQRNIGRVKDGALAATAMYLSATTQPDSTVVGSNPVEESMDDIDILYSKGYITPRTHVGKSGYFFTDDRLACVETDDYAHLALRRVIDKAYRIAYATMLENLLDEIYVNEDGTMQTVVIKSWQSSLEDAINRQMTAKGELSADVSNGESGCVCYINEKQNVLTTKTIEMELKVRPFGYSEHIKINLGFQVTTTNS